MPQTKNPTAQITGGVTTGKFLEALSGEGDSLTVTFTLEGGNTATVRITQVQREDGSGCKFNFWGRTVPNTVYVYGFYNSRSGKGFIEYNAK
ncbi:hypothetical protein COU77_00295 [Candidatus Peregrinibacteria bacterium CG10_big_fil_rev_8_21_14_0_10_49_16]|nr:MAG: hypothetical protein COU77_00295 [Candidatus Peregrinibacteria bacterium CG10_big_fil_rev_8_21_14_0_10_49_16]